MATNEDYQGVLDRMAVLKETVIDRLAPRIIGDPQLGDALSRQIDELFEAVVRADAATPPPPDSGLAELVGIGKDAAPTLGKTRHPYGISGYDDTVTSERILATGDLYYLYQHEKIGIFRAILKRQELFRAGTVRLSSGAGAFGLYRYDRRQVLRFTLSDRLQAYRRVFGYTATPPAPGAQPNHDFHRLFVHFMTETAQFFRDKRVSELFRQRTTDPTFGSIAMVRRSGLDLRNNLKHASYGHVNVLRIEVLQLLDEAFRILESPDIKKLFGADTAWDVIEEIMRQYLNRPQINASQRSRMAETGREVLRWLAQPHILNSTRAEFETLLLDIAHEAEEWLTSAEALGITRPRRERREPPWDERRPARAALGVAPARLAPVGATASSNGAGYTDGFGEG